MKKLTLVGFVLVFALAFLMTTHLVYAKPTKPTPTPPGTIFYYGYAMLDDGNSNLIVSDEGGQYVDRHFASGPPKSRYGDRIEVRLKYNASTERYDLTCFICFLGRPCPVYNSDRRVKINYDMKNENTILGIHYFDNRTVADMLAYKNTKPFPSDSSLRGMLNDDSVSILFEKCWGSEEPTDKNKVWAAFLVDKSNDATDPNAITQTNLLNLNSSAPYYWGNRNGAACEGIEDEDQIAFFLLDDQYTAQINFEEIDWELQSGIKVPIKWRITPNVSSVEISVRTIDPSQFDTCVYPLDQERKVLYTIPYGLPFNLTVSKYPIASLAPKQGNPATTWGEIKGQ